MSNQPKGHGIKLTQLQRRQFLRLGVTAGAGIALAGPLLAACASDESGESPASTALEKPTSKPDRLIIRTWADPFPAAFLEAAGDGFTDRTGIPLEFDHTAMTVADTLVRTAVQGGSRPPVDVVHTIGRAAYTAQMQKVATPFDLDLFTNWDQVTEAALPEGGSSYVDIYNYTAPILYRKDKVTLDDATSWEELWNPDYAGKLFMSGIFDFVAFPVAKMLDIDLAKDDMGPVWDKLAELRPSIKVIGDDTAFIENVKAGEIWLGSILIADALALQAAGIDVGWVVPTEGALLTGDAMYVPQNLPDDVTYYAQMFINDLLAAEAQTTFADLLGNIPVNDKSEPPAFALDDPAFPFTPEQVEKYAITESDPAAAKNTDDWQAKYLAAIQG